MNNVALPMLFSMQNGRDLPRILATNQWQFFFVVLRIASWPGSARLVEVGLNH